MDTEQRDEFEIAIWASVISAHGDSLPAGVAEYLLELKYPSRDRVRMHELAEKARAGTLSARESAEAEAYGRVGSLLTMIHSKARMALKAQPSKQVKVR